MSTEIFLDHYNNTYYPGETLSGRIECTFNSKENLRAIRIKFWGCAKAFWNEDDLLRRRATLKYFAEEVYMNADYNLVEGGEDFSLPAGKHVYPFFYIPPTRLPSSFEGTRGNIRYYVTVVVERPWKFDYKAKLTLKVGSIIDLNFIPHIREPVAISEDKTILTCWCNDAGTITFNLSMRTSGYVPGQYVYIRAYVRNLSNVSIKCVKFKVFGSYEYISQSSYTNNIKPDPDVIAKCVESGIGAHGEKSWTSILRIPTNRIYPNLIPCSIINVDYNLQAKVVLPCRYFNLKLLHPITIGTVPLSVMDTLIQGP